MGSFKSSADPGIWKWEFRFCLSELDPGVNWCPLVAGTCAVEEGRVDLVSDQVEGLESHFLLSVKWKCPSCRP